jgi:hypothetical protein
LWAHSGSSVAAMSGVAGRQDIGGSGYSRVMAAAAARQWRRLQEGGSSSTEVGAGQRRQRGGNRAVLAAAERWQQRGSNSAVWLAVAE